MSATTPTVQGGYRNLQLGTALVAIALAIVLVAAFVALGATASRGQAQAAPQPVHVPSLARGFVPKRGPIVTSPYAVQGDHGWATDARIAAPTFLELPRPFDPATLAGASAPATMLELPRPFDPSTLSGPTTPIFIDLPRVFDPSTIGTPAKGGQGTRVRPVTRGGRPHPRPSIQPGAVSPTRAGRRLRMSGRGDLVEPHGAMLRPGSGSPRRRCASPRGRRGRCTTAARRHGPPRGTRAAPRGTPSRTGRGTSPSPPRPGLPPLAPATGAASDHRRPRRPHRRNP